MATNRVSQRDQGNTETPARKGTSMRGFAGMDSEKQREIASKGGRAAHAKGTAHEFTVDEAREAGRKGGESVSRNREHMANIGREGGKQSRGGGRTRKNVNEGSAASASASRDGKDTHQ